ncbi:MFS general substrate transporter [Thozetella sp. PMI_491]|nr:MFS general substrate transporter [Thozetella sp. PMI_491]
MDPASETCVPAAYPARNASFYMVVSCLCICCFISALDTIILSSTLPAIAASLQATTANAYWCSSAFLFAQSVIQLVYAVFAKALDRRTCMLAALGFFTFASILCATARDVQWLIAARTVQGIGTGGINALIQLILTDIVPIEERPKYTGILTLFAAIALVTGGLCGAAIVQSVSWPVIFWINLPLCVPTIFGFAFCLRVPERQDSVWTTLKRTDWGGAALVTASLGGILFALNSGNAVYPWSSGNVLAPLVCGTAGLFLFAAYERLVAKATAILPGRLFSSPTAASAYIMTIIHAMIVWTTTYYFFLYLTFCSYSYLGAAVMMLPATITFPLAAGIAGHIIGRTLKYKTLNIFAFLLLVGGLGGLTALHESSPVSLRVVLLLMLGTGCGIPFISKVFMAQTAVAESDVFMATAVVATATSIGECFGVAVASTAFQNRWDALLERELRQGLLEVIIKGRDAEKSAEMIASLDEVTVEIYQRIAMQSFQTVWIIMAVLAGIALVLVIWSRETSRKVYKQEE